jgi:hypothetical protein
MVNPNRFYTYAYLRKDRTPYYIGKGTGRRIYSKKGRPCSKPKDKTRIIFLKQNLTEEESFKHEKYMIAVFGRKDLGTGILHNRTDGGDGASGAIKTLETRAKLSAANKGENNHNYGKTHSPETRAKMSAALKGENHYFYGKTHSQKTKEKIGASSKGKIISPETKAKMSAANKGKNNPNYGKMWITDEINNLMISKNDIIPEGFRKGIRRLKD